MFQGGETLTGKAAKEKDKVTEKAAIKEMDKVTDEARREERILRMTTGKIYPLLIRMAIPSMVGMMVSTVYGMTDTYFVGKLNDAALTASVGVVFTFISIVQAIGFWFGYGAGNHASRMIGNKETERAEEMAATGVFLAILTGIVIVIGGLCLLRPMAELLGAGKDKALLSATMDYLRITVCGAPFLLISNVIYNELRLTGSGKSSMMGLVVGMGINMALDPVLILHFHLGVKGAAYASFLGQLTGMVMLCMETRKDGNLRIDLRKSKLDVKHLTAILSGGAPNFCRQGISSVSSLLLNQVAGGFSVDALAAVTIANKITYIAYALVIGFGQGFQPICAMNFGAKKYDRIRKAFYLTLATVTGFLVISVAFLLWRTELLTKAFTAQGSVSALVIPMVRAQCIVLPFMGYYVLIGMCLQNIGKFGLATCVTTLENGACFIPALFLCTAFLGETGLVAFKPVASAASLFISILIGTRAWKKYLTERKASE